MWNKSYTKSPVFPMILGSLAIFFLSGCESTRDMLSMNKEAPDEFLDYTSEKSLSIPPSFEVLPRPTEASTGEDNPFPAISSASHVSSQASTPGSHALLKRMNLSAHD